MRELEVAVMEDIVRRIQKAGTITETADWQIQRLTILGTSTEDIRKLIERAVDGNEEMVRKLYEEVIAKEYTSMKELYEATGKEFIPYEQNAELQQIVNAMIRQSSEDLVNITKSTGFMLELNGQKVWTPLAQVYNDYLDTAVMGMIDGTTDYNTATRKLVNQMTNSGLRSDHKFSDTGSYGGVDYASGWHNRVDVAARRALLTGFGQVAGKVTDMNAQRLGTNFFEVSWHGGARPDHAAWQGRVYSKEQLRSVCGLGEGGGLLGWNCRHSYYPFIPGISERQYSDEWLAEMDAKEAEKQWYRGKEYNTYEATQKQRQIETNLRAYREKVQLMRQGGVDSETVMLTRCKYQALLDEYHEFSRKFNLPEQLERVYTGRTAGRIAPSRQSYAQWQAEQINKAKERAEEKRRKDMDMARKSVSYEGIPKTWKISSEKLDAGKTNPSGYTDNCVNCVMAYEMRSRRYEVVADKYIKKLGHNPFAGWNDPDVIKVSSDEDPVDVITKLMEEWGVGSRCQIVGLWNSRSPIFWEAVPDTGHAFAAEKRESGVVYIDPQENKVYDASVFKRLHDIEFCRIDNLEPNDLGNTACKKE